MTGIRILRLIESLFTIACALLGMSLSFLILTGVFYSDWLTDLLMEGSSIGRLFEEPSDRFVAAFGVMLFIISWMAANEVIQRNLTLGRIEFKMDNALALRQKSLAASTKPITSLEQGLAFLTSRFAQTKRSVDHVAFAPKIVGYDERASNLTKTIERNLHSNRIQYRYVAGVGSNDMNHRLSGIAKWLNDPRVNTYRVVIFDFGNNDRQPTGINFHVFDDEEIFVYFPGARIDDLGHAIVTNDPEIVSAFKSYFDVLWANGKSVDTKDVMNTLRMRN